MLNRKTALTLLAIAASGGLACEAWAAAKPKPAGKGLFVADYATNGEWKVQRFTKDAKGQKVSHCVASAGFDGDRILHLRFDAQKLLIAFSGGYGFEPPSKPTKISMIFDEKRDDAHTVTVKPYETGDGMTLSAFSQLNADGPGHEDSLMNHNLVEFTYQNANGEQGVSYDLAGSNKAMKALFACVNGTP